jgi:hypothetical protein
LLVDKDAPSVVRAPFVLGTASVQVVKAYFLVGKASPTVVKATFIVVEANFIVVEADFIVVSATFLVGVYPVPLGGLPFLASADARPVDRACFLCG